MCLGAKAHCGLVPPGAVPPAAAAHAPLLRASSRYYEEATGVGLGGQGTDVRPGGTHAPQDEQTVCWLTLRLLACSCMLLSSVSLNMRMQQPTW